MMPQITKKDKICQECGNVFHINESVKSYLEKKFDLPSENICQDCIQRSLLSFRNERRLYKSKSDLSGKDMFSLYSPDKTYPIYTQDEWNSDDWNALDYGTQYDFEKPFFGQFEELFKKVPKPNLYNLNSENSDYNSGIINSKNAYLNFYGTAIIDSAYTTASYEIKDSYDIWWSAFIERSYEMISCDKMYDSAFCLNCSSSRRLLFCEECIECEDCTLCFGLRGKKFHIENKEYSKEEYRILKKSFETGKQSSIRELRKRLENFVLKMPRKFTHVYSCENCSGDYVFQSKNCIDCFTTVGGEDSYNVFEGGRFLEAYDSSHIYDSKYIFRSVLVAENSYRIFFSIGIGNSRDLYYCNGMEGCHDCFGCTGLKNRSYCILNEQYEKEEYEMLLPRIIEHLKKTGEWGKFFPGNLSPFGYNESVASDYYPLEKEGALIKGFNWSDFEGPKPEVKKVIPATRLPDDIKDIPDEILDWAIECEVSGKPFRLIKQELEFYRKQELPVPRRHPDERHLDRIKVRNPRKLYERDCMNCGIQLETTYPPDSPEIIYCERCSDNLF